jgi:hypothetical protein
MRCGELKADIVTTNMPWYEIEDTINIKLQEHKDCEFVDLKYVNERTVVLLYKECKECKE